MHRLVKFKFWISEVGTSFFVVMVSAPNLFGLLKNHFFGVLSLWHANANSILQRTN
jgi:hypothetical protein